jgi:radical SAM superfamily enzyme YgiQ (UPF0313 family)
MRILFILPYDNTYKYKGSFTKSISYAPLTLSVLAALVPQEMQAEIKIVDEGVDKPCLRGNFDLVAITCVTSSAQRAYELCKYWKEKGSYVVLGGVHPTLMPEEASPHADTIFIGLAEETFPQFLQDYLQGTPQKLYRHKSKCEYLSLPTPRRDLISKKYMKIPTVIANRGCLNQCSYCSINKLWGKNSLTRPLDEVIQEIKTLNPKRIILLDPSPTSNEEYAAQFFQALIPLKIKWSGLSTIDIVKKPHLFDLMIKSGCEGILAGFESINNANLVSVEKRTNKVAEYKYAVKQFHQANIPILGCFVAGFDHDTKESLLATVDFIEEIGIDLPRFSILTPFPGTTLFADYEKENRILTKNWGLYDTMHVVFEPKHMSPAELQKIFFEMWKKAYTTKKILKRLRNTKKEKIIKLSANLGFKYYAYKLRKAGD